MKKPFVPLPDFRRLAPVVFAPIAQEFGLELIWLDSGSLRLESQSCSVEVCLTSGHTQCVNVTLAPKKGASGERFGLRLIADFVGRAGDFGPPSLGNRKDVRAALEGMAEELRLSCGDILRGRFTAWGALREFAHSRAKMDEEKWEADAEKWRVADIREKADLAFRSHEYPIAAEYYELLGEHMKPHERERLKFARRKR